MKLIFIRPILLLLCPFLLIELYAQPEPQGKRLKDIVTSPLIGALLVEENSNETVFLREFNTGTVNWYPAWNGWLSRYEFNFTSINNRVNILHSNNRSIMMHMFVGPNQYLPDWFKNNSWLSADMDDMLKNLIRSLMQSNNNANKIETWNIVNEVINYNANGFESTKWLEMGYEEDASGLTGSEKIFTEFPVYVRKAFEYAALYTNGKLELRDYGIEFSTSTKFKVFYQLAKHLKNKGVRLDAAGLQCHFSIQEKNYNWNDFKAAITKLKDLGVIVNITELDIADSEKSWTNEKAETQKQLYYECIKAACEAGVASIHTWGVTDNADPGWLLDQSPLLFDKNYNAKPAYYGFQAALTDYNLENKGIAVRASGSTGEEQMELYIDDVKTGTTQTLSTNMADYFFRTGNATGNIKIKFVNDGNTANGEDKNVQIDYITVNDNTFQAEDQVTNTGSWNSSQSQCGGVPSEWLFCEGYIDFGSANTPSIRVIENITTSKEGMTLFPNPVQGNTVTVTLKSSTEKTTQLNILHANGNLMIKRQVKLNKGANTITFNTGSLQKGVYIVEIETDGSKITKKLVKL
jgi:endo-1,4-beta-xylanase